MDSKYTFSFIEEKILPLWDYGWLSVSVCKVSNSDLENYNPNELFSSLLSDPIYLRSYMTPRELDRNARTHGPFIVECLKPGDFARTDFQKVVEHLHQDFNDPTLDRPPTEDKQKEALSFMERLDREDLDCYMLDIDHDPDVKKEINHEFFWIHDVFHEYVLVQRKTKQLYICVVGID